MSDVIIVGAGMGGLAAANVLAGRGLSPLVLESESTVGGKAGYVTIDGVEIDTGPSVLT
ncbi:MAG: NAD(P)-binding protein, partial [Myxococcota bacterium]